MEQRISLLTLGVHDLQQARSFYEQLGWRGQQVQETVFFQAGGLAVVLWDRTKLAADCGLEDRGANGSTAAFSGVALAHNVRQREQVDEVLTAARAAGAAITRPATTTFYGGYAGVFTDPDGHAWEVAHNPGFPLAADGSLVLPDFDTPDGPTDRHD